MNAHGTGVAPLTTSDGDYREPDWQPITLETVGGVLNPINKLEIITAYITLTGLIIAGSTVYIIKKRRSKI